jgi:hypothetical protein
MKLIMVGVFLLVASRAGVDWHTGRVSVFSFGYDGVTVVLEIAGLSKTACTCYPTWPTSLCLNRSRQSFREEYALSLKARATDAPIHVYIDESTCGVFAMYENA